MERFLKHFKLYTLIVVAVLAFFFPSYVHAKEISSEEDFYSYTADAILYFHNGANFAATAFTYSFTANERYALLCCESSSGNSSYYGSYTVYSYSLYCLSENNMRRPVDYAYRYIYWDGSESSISYITDSICQFNACELSTNIPVFTDFDLMNFYLQTGIMVPDFDVEDYTPDTSVSLLNFKASPDPMSIFCTWNGVKGLAFEEYEKTGICRIELGLSKIDNPGGIYTKICYENVKLSSGQSNILLSLVKDAYPDCYVLFVQATPFWRFHDEPNNILYRGNSSIAYFDKDGNFSHYEEFEQDWEDDGLKWKYPLSEKNGLCLSNVSVSSSFFGVSALSLGFKTVSWVGLELNGKPYPLFCPDADTKVVASYVVYTSPTSFKRFILGTTTIGKGKYVVDVDSIVKNCEKNGYLWNNCVFFTPYYDDAPFTYMGSPTSVDMYTGEIIQLINDENGDPQDVVVDPGPDPSDKNLDVTHYTSLFFNTLHSLVNALGSLPSLYATVFSFLPSIYMSMIGTLLIVIFILRILGR